MNKPPIVKRVGVKSGDGFVHQGVRFLLAIADGKGRRISIRVEGDHDVPLEFIRQQGIDSGGDGET